MTTATAPQVTERRRSRCEPLSREFVVYDVLVGSAVYCVSAAVYDDSGFVSVFRVMRDGGTRVTGVRRPRGRAIAAAVRAFEEAR